MFLKSWNHERECYWNYLLWLSFVSVFWFLFCEFSVKELCVKKPNIYMYSATHCWPARQNCSICRKNCPLRLHLNKDENVLSAHTIERLLTGITAPPMLQNQSQRCGWWNRDHLLANSRRANCPPTDPLSSIRQAPLSLGFCDAVGWNLQFTVHLPVTFYTSLVTELSFFLGCLDDLTKGPCDSHLLVRS